MTSIEDEIQNRIEAGEFNDSHGDLDIGTVIKATAELTKNKKEAIVGISGLWPNERSSKVAYEGRTKSDEDIVIPGGSKILVFNNNKTDDRQPELNLCYVED